MLVPAAQLVCSRLPTGLSLAGLPCPSPATQPPPARAPHFHVTAKHPLQEAKMLVQSVFHVALWPGYRAAEQRLGVRSARKTLKQLK